MKNIDRSAKTTGIYALDESRDLTQDRGVNPVEGHTERYTLGPTCLLATQQV